MSVQTFGQVALGMMSEMASPTPTALDRSVGEARDLVMEKEKE